MEKPTVRHFVSTCRLPELAVRLLVILGVVALTACANVDGRPVLERWPENERGSVTSYLQSLREYLAMSPQMRALHRSDLLESADDGGRAEQLEYAFVLSVELEDEIALQQAREHFETMLASPDPLPVALDGLVRLQLANTVARLDTLAQLRDLRETARTCGSDYRQCNATVLALSEDLEVQHRELNVLRDKLEALTRIEQTVDDDPETPRFVPTQDDDKEDNDAASPSDTSR